MTNEPSPILPPDRMLVVRLSAMGDVIHAMPAIAALRRAKPDALVLHPGPMIRGLEIDPAVADAPQCAVLEQVTNGLAVRMALLYHLIGGAAADAPHPAKE